MLQYFPAEQSLRNLVVKALNLPQVYWLADMDKRGVAKDPFVTIFRYIYTFYHP